MLYKTHQKFAQLFGVVGLTTAFSSTILPTFTWGYSLSDNVLVGTLVLMGYSASTFGGEFPDIDSPTSVPARRYPLIHKIFRLFGVKHRGKFSHDFTSLAIFFSLLLAGAYTAFSRFWDSRSVMLGIALYLIIFYGREIGNDVAFKLSKNDAGRRRLRLPSILGGSLIVFIFFLFMGWFPVSSSPTSLLKVSSALKPMTYITIIFAWIGAYSHLFADMLTNEGVYIFWHKISPAKWVMRINKIPFLLPLITTGVSYYIGNIIGAIMGFVIGIFLQFMVAKTDLKTGSQYEKVVRRVVRLMLYPAFAILIYTAFGGVLQ